MFQCHVCGSTEAKESLETQFFWIDERPVIVEHIPAMVCVRCGEVIFEIETIEKIRRMIHGEAKPIKSITTEVFEFA